MTYQLLRLCARASLAIGLAALAAHHLHTGDKVSAAAPGRAPIACDAVAALVLPDTIITLTESVPAGSFTPPGTSQALQVPAFCRVAATSAPAVKFEVWLPRDTWNGKFHTAGNGGMAGVISYGAMQGALDRGYATASTDTGHVRPSAGGFDASWALGRPDLIEDFGHRSIHLTAVHGKTIVETYYGNAPTQSYYVGCSKGGQQGMMEAQRYPEDFDGLVVGNPAHNWTSFYAGAHLWYALSTLADPESYIPAEKVKILGNAVTAACDALDGIEDGVIDDPRRCTFNPEALTCDDVTAGEHCFSEKQVKAIKAIWQGPVNAAGEVLYPGLVPGGEAGPGGWSRWVTGPEAFTGTHWLAAEGFMKYMVFNDPDWDFRSWDYDRDFSTALARTGAALDANDPDLRPLRDGGGKLLVYHGWSDADISPLGTIDYFEEAVTVLGGDTDAPSALAETQKFFRLFMVPGMGHCRGGPGPDRFDMLSALERWVEQDEAPTRILASKIEDGEVVRTRPLCPYPQVARWSGSGSTDDAANFACVTP